MKFSTVFFAASLVAAVAAIPQATKTSSIPVPTNTSSYPPAVVKCLDGCAEEDVTCRAHCLDTPAPTEENIGDTTECVAACPKGDGSAEQSEEYSRCSQACINEKFSPNPSSDGDSTGTDSSPSPTGSDGAEDDEAGTGNEGGNSTSTTTEGAPQTTDTGAASGLTIGGSFVGVMAVLAAFLAL